MTTARGQGWAPPLSSAVLTTARLHHPDTKQPYAQGICRLQACQINRQVRYPVLGPVSLASLAAAGPLPQNLIAPSWGQQRTSTLWGRVPGALHIGLPGRTAGCAGGTCEAAAEPAARSWTPRPAANDRISAAPSRSRPQLQLTNSVGTSQPYLAGLLARTRPPPPPPLPAPVRLCEHLCGMFALCSSVHACGRHAPAGRWRRRACRRPPQTFRLLGPASNPKPNSTPLVAGLFQMRQRTSATAAALALVAALALQLAAPAAAACQNTVGGACTYSASNAQSDCCAGKTCHPVLKQCYPSPRTLGQPCLGAATGSFRAGLCLGTAHPPLDLGCTWLFD